MQSESQNGVNNDNQRDQWSFDWWKTQHSNSGKLLQVGKFQNQNSEHHTLNLYNQEIDINQHWDQQQFNKKANRKMQNKVSAKRARQKKKNLFEQIKIKNKLLQQQNKKLRQGMYCKRCSRLLDRQEISKLKFENKYYQKPSKNSIGKEKQFQFQQIQINKKKQNHRAKLWMAIGILMLILGFQIHGMYGDDQTYVRVPKQDINRWTKNFNDNNYVEKIDFRMKTKGESQINMKGSRQTSKKIQGLFDKFSFQNQQQFEEQLNEEEQQDRFTFELDLLYAIQAEFEGNGIYI